MSKLSDGVKSAAGSVKDGLASANTRARGTANAASTRLQQKAADTIKSSKQLASKAREKSSDSIDKNPFAILLGGLTLGALAGALIPKSAAEKKILGGAGKKLNEKARMMADAAKQAGMKKVDQMGINKDSARAQFRDLVSKASDAVKEAGKAAGDAARKKD